MKFTIPIAMCDPAHYVPLAETADACGFHGIAVPDGVFYPEQVEAKYPYTFDGSRFWEPDTPFLEPWVVIPAMAARTERLFFYTYVLKLPIRHPLLVARTVQSAAVLSNNRVGLGVGTSWIPEEAEWLGTDFSTRGARANEAIEIIRKVLAGGMVDYQGEYYRFGKLQMAPAPSKPVPIIVGGHSRPALRRAARLGDGWCSANCTEENLKEILGRLEELLAEQGRDLGSFDIHALCIDVWNRAGYERLVSYGVDNIYVVPWAMYGADPASLDEKKEAVERFAREVINP